NCRHYSRSGPAPARPATATYQHQYRPDQALLEGKAETVLKSILNDPDWALTLNWPLNPGEKLSLAWWMAAQILRTTRQR
ncbi:hypothetical protein, partial [Streptomyces sp. NPDC003480]